MAASLLRRVGLCRCAVGIFISRTRCTFCVASSQNGAADCCNSSARLLPFGHRTICTAAGSHESLPWLMLPPTFEDDGVVYNFYSLAHKKVLKHPKSSRGESESESPDDDAEFVGSSHGWLALFNRRNNNLFLSNPLSDRHIKLPSFEFLRDSEINSRDSRVTKVILSSSPDVEGCRAMMTFGPANRLALCSPGLSWRWSPVGSLLLPRILCSREGIYDFARICEDFVYCNRRKVLTCMEPCEFDLPSFDYRNDESHSPIENWDIRNPLIDDWHTGNHHFEYWDIGYPPMEIWNIGKPVYLKKNYRDNGKGENTISWMEENMCILEERCIQIPHLVYGQECDRLYLLMRFVEVMEPDGRPLDRVPVCPIRGLRGYYPCKTFGFIVFKVDEDGRYEVVDDLNGLAIFVGINHSFAIDSGSGELKPNSIYFTNARRIKMLYGSDTGIFDYVHKAISPVIDPDNDDDDVDDASRRIKRDESMVTTQKIESSVLWFSS